MRTLTSASFAVSNREGFMKSGHNHRLDSRLENEKAKCNSR